MCFDSCISCGFTHVALSKFHISFIICKLMVLIVALSCNMMFLIRRTVVDRQMCQKSFMVLIDYWECVYDVMVWCLNGGTNNQSNSIGFLLRTFSSRTK